MAAWYGMLNTVVEGWEELGFSDPEIDELLIDEQMKKLLKRYRHGAFHYQADYIRPTILMTDSSLFGRGTMRPAGGSIGCATRLRAGSLRGIRAMADGSIRGTRRGPTINQDDA